jgi:hypothetical protein
MIPFQTYHLIASRHLSLVDSPQTQLYIVRFKLKIDKLVVH